VLRELLGELLQLEEEFTKVTIDRGVISVITEPVELDDVYLGSFQIELPIAQLVGDRVGSDVFQIIAIEPHPATGSDVVHPHVRDGRLCAGDATVPLASALRDGRLSDAFLTVRSVLNTYNGSSAYVPLHDWNGIACANCESIVSEDDRFYCERCRSDVCNDCYATCDVCGEGCCTSCLEKDRRSNRLCCGECRHRCGGCSRIVDSDSFDDELALCPECRDEREREEQEQQQTEEIHDDDNDDHNGAERTTADAVELAGQSADGPITGGAAEAAEPVSA